MKIVVSVLLFIFFAGKVSAKESAPQNARWKKLMRLVSQEMEILEKAKRKGPEFHYRMLELHSEKLKLLHEKNNKEFLIGSKNPKNKKSKESYFTETRNYYAKSKAYGLSVLKKFPTSSVRPSVLFAMALNSRDYGRDTITEKYLLETISLVKDPHHSLRHHAETALADFYYNEKRFQDAINYYVRVIKKTEDEWLTKHYFNMSWCFIKTRDFDKAIKAIRKSYELSKNKTYVNIKDQVLDNIGSFYVYAGIPLEGLKFYLANEKDSIPYLLPMAKKAADKGHEKDAETILGAAQEQIDRNKWYHYQEEVYHSYLDFYRLFNRFEDHEKTSRKVVAYYKKAESDKELKLKTEMKEDAIEKIRSLAGFLQVKLSKNMKEDGGSYKDDELEVLLNFFSHLIALDSKRKAEYLYFRGETYYSVKQFLKAAPAYVEAIKVSQAEKNLDMARKSLDSLLALTGLEVLEKELNKKYLIFAYSEHIKLWPRDPKSELIYPKLFEIYLLSHDDVKASAVIKDFNKAYPEHLADQQKMMTKILDLFIEKKDTKKLASWIHVFKDGFLKFPKSTIEKVEITLGNLLFMEYQNLAKKGDKLAAAKGFESIYSNKLYTDKVKSQSAFFAALTYLELAETAKSYSWLVLAYNKMNEAEKLARREEELKMAERSYKLQDFVTSYKISQFFLRKFCHLKDDTQNRFYEIAIMTALVEENPEAAENIIIHDSDCLKKPESRKIAISQLYSFFEKKGNFRELRLFAHRHKEPDIQGQYRFTLQKWYWEKTDLNFKEQVTQELKDLKHPETEAWLKEMDDYKRASKLLTQINEEVIWDKPVFDGDAYNKALEGHLLKLQDFKKSFEHLTLSTQIDLVIFSTRMFASLYETAGNKIGTIHPKGLDAQTFKEFNSAMRQVGSQFLTVAKKYNTQLDKALVEKETLVWGSRAIASVEQIENPVFSFYTGLTMDKGMGE